MTDEYRIIGVETKWPTRPGQKPKDIRRWVVEQGFATYEQADTFRNSWGAIFPQYEYFVQRCGDSGDD